jgi:hypothetical protein
VKSPVGIIKSSEEPFTVDIQPPNPIFVQPPLEIVRQPPRDDLYNEKVLLPNTQKLDIIIEFPDGHKRPLVRTTLYVDGQVVAENKSQPFDTFTWDLSSYTVSGEHKIVVEAVDALGLSKTSMEIPVTVTVVQAPHGAAALFARYRQDITVGAVGLAGLVLLLMLFIGRFRLMFGNARASREAQADPLTQSVTAVVETKQRSKRGRPATSDVKMQQVDAPAYLRRLTLDLAPASVSPIPLNQKEISFGADPVQSMLVLDDPSLASRHARVVQTEEGNFLLVDAGTIAGTWVNFEPVGKEGRSLQHGDVVHFGQLAFRFELKNPPPLAEPKIVKETPA